MLPILKNKVRQTGIIIHERKPDEAKSEDKASEPSDIESIASDMIKAMESKDAKMLAMLLKEAHDCCANPSSSEESNDYDDLNQKAAAESAE